MSVSLATLVSRLTTAVPARSSVPSASQYQQCVEDAVADLSARCPNEKITTISVVSGTATYTLPSDFLYDVLLESMISETGVVISSTGILPVDADWDEEITYAGQTLTITPTPTYTASRYLWYAAGHVLDASDNYADMTTQQAAAALLLAQALALGMQANASAGSEGWKYQIGDEMVDKTGIGKGLQSRADALLAQYERAVARLAKSGVGLRADVDVA